MWRLWLLYQTPSPISRPSLNQLAPVKSSRAGGKYWEPRGVPAPINQELSAAKTIVATTRSPGKTVEGNTSATFVGSGQLRVGPTRRTGHLFLRAADTGDHLRVPTSAPELLSDTLTSSQGGRLS